MIPEHELHREVEPIHSDWHSLVHAGNWLMQKTARDDTQAYALADEFHTWWNGMVRALRHWTERR